MATSGKITIATGSNSGKTSYFNITSNLRLIVDWVLKSQDITNNTSTITVTMSVQHSAISLTAGSNDCSFIFGGVTRTWTGPNLIRSTNTSVTTVLKDGSETTHDIVVTHSADGTFTGDFIAEYRLSSSNSFVYSGQTFGYITNRNSPASITLPTIARKSSMTTSGSNVGSNITFAITRASSGFTHDISYRYGSTTTAIATGVGTSYTWSGSSNLSLASVCTNAPSMSITFILTTKSGNTVIGTTEYARTLYFPEATFRPQLTIVVSEGSNRTSYLKGLSTVKVVPSVTVVYSSVITSYSATIGSWAYSGSSPITVTSSVLSTAGTVAINYKITNSRGYSAERNASITVLDYNPPTISNLTVRRVDANGNPDISGDKAYIEFRLGISSVPSNNGLASGYPKGAYTKTTVAWGTSDSSITSFSYNSSTGYYYKTINLDTDYAFHIKIQVKDKYSNEVSSYTTISTAYAIMHFRETGRGLGIGGISNADRLQVYMPIESNSWVSGTGYWFQYGYQTNEASVFFKNDTSSATHPHYTRLYGGNPNSETAFGIWDSLNGHSILYYQDANGNLGIMNTADAIARNGDVFIRGRSMNSVTNKSTLSKTYSSNSYITSNGFNSIQVYRRGEIYIIRGNMYINEMPSNSTFITVGTISNYTAAYEAVVTIPAQNGSGVLLFQVSSSGTISIYKGSGVTINSYCRCNISVPLA